MTHRAELPVDAGMTPAPLDPPRQNKCIMLSAPSSTAASPAPPSASTLPNKNGLYYTRWALVAVFGYLLLGDFCLQFMETVMPSIMPLQLDAAGASNTVKAVVMGTIAAFFNMVMNPYISFKSDGMRTAWGRRRPILLWMTPFVCLALILIAYAPEVSRWLQEGLGLGTAVSGGMLPAAPDMAMLVVTLAGAVIIFQLFNNLMAPVFYYLFVDVVPDAFMGRFIALFRIVGALAGYVFNMWIFPHAMTHTRVIYVGAALFYGVGFLIMTLRVKEGVYSPPVHEKTASMWEKARVYVKECYSHQPFSCTCCTGAGAPMAARIIMCRHGSEGNAALQN